MSRFLNSRGDQMLDTFPDEDPVHAHGSGKLFLGGKYAPRRLGAAKNLIADLPEDLAADAFFLMGLCIFTIQGHGPN
jgi:hypothetical protein